MQPKATILIVDDQVEILENIGLALEADGYAVLSASDGNQAFVMLQSHSVDLILSDIAMPRLNGYQLYERVRADVRWVAIPFIFLTARAMDSDIRYGKALGVDDYLIKPIQPEDLLATVEGKLSRARQLAGHAAAVAPAPAQPSTTIVHGKLRIDTAQHRVWFGEQQIELSAREFVLLEYLARHRGTTVSPHELIHVTHGLDTDDIEAGGLLRPLVRSLRRKLGYAVGEEGCIENVRSVGYRLVAP